MRKSDFRAGFKAPAPAARQADFRLSTPQRAELSDALSPHELTTSLLHVVEDSLYRHREKHERLKRVRRDWPRVESWLTRTRHAETLARDLRALLPLFEGEDDALMALLEQRAQSWKEFADEAPLPEKGRPANGEISWTSLWIVEALADAGVPLTPLGRNGPVCDVLRLVRRWADELEDQPPRRRQDIYAFTRIIVTSYLENQRQRRAVVAHTTTARAHVGPK